MPVFMRLSERHSFVFRPARDGTAAARDPRALVALLPATATVIGVVVLRQLPTAVDLAGIGLVMVGVALHRPEPASVTDTEAPPS
jgi:hypothetical protein